MVRGSETSMNERMPMSEALRRMWLAIGDLFFDLAAAAYQRAGETWLAEVTENDAYELRESQ